MAAPGRDEPVTPSSYLAERLPVWHRDIIAFARDTIRVVNPSTGKIGPVEFDEHQTNFLREASRMLKSGSIAWSTVVASWPKREGKSFCIAILLLWRAVCWAGQASVVLANSERQAASVIYDELVGFVRNSPVLKHLVREDDIETRKLTISINGNTVVCLPCNYRTVQGVAVTGILAVDELHAVPDIRAFNYLASQTEHFNAQIGISSQAGSPDDANPVWRLYRASQEPDNDSIFFDYRSEHASPYAIALAKRQKATLTPAEYRMMHENAWVGLGDKLFDADLVQDASATYDEPQTPEALRALVTAWGLQNLSMDFGAGLDRAGVGRSGDRSVLTLVARFVDPQGAFPSVYRVLRQWVFATGDEAEILSAFGALRALCAGHHVGIIMEQYGCSDLVDKVRGAELRAPTTPRQHAMFTALWRAFNERRIQAPEAMGVYTNRRGEQATGLLRSELLAFEYGYTANGLPRYGTQTGHDDAVYSLAWAVEAVPEMSTSAAYSADEIVVSTGKGWVANYA